MTVALAVSSVAGLRTDGRTTPTAVRLTRSRQGKGLVPIDRRSPTAPLSPTSVKRPFGLATSTRKRTRNGMLLGRPRRDGTVATHFVDRAAAIPTP